MISHKRFSSDKVDGILTRFLSDFIIPTEQHVRVYNYVYDPINGDDTLHIEDPATGLYLRKIDAPNSEDLVGLDKWDLVDNSILFYEAPHTTSSVYLEVATSPEEFGGTIAQPSVERAAESAQAAELSEANAATSEANAATSETNASTSETNAGISETNAGISETNAGASASAAATSEANAGISETNASTSETNAATSASNASTSETNASASEAASASSAAAALVSEANSAISATNAELEAWEAEAERLTADSYATQPIGQNVIVYTSDGDGTFTQTPQVGVRSALHHADASDSTARVSKAGDIMTGNLEAPSVSIGGEYLSPFGFKNKIINGGFDIWQRGTSFNVSGLQYTSDRWLVNIPTGGIVSQQNRDINGTRTQVLSFASAISTTRELTTRLEESNIYSNKTWTLSFNGAIESTATVTLRVRRVVGGVPTEMVSTLIDVGVSLSNKVTHTFTLPDYSTDVYSPYDYLEVSLLTFDSTAVPTLLIGNLQLEEGSVATPFEQRPVGLELSLCQRYYEIFSRGAASTWKYSPPAINAELIQQSFLVEKRVLPSMAFVVSPSYANCSLSALGVHSSSAWIIQVNVIALGLYTAYSYTVEADAEL